MSDNSKQLSSDFYASDSFAPLLRQMKLDSVDDVFAFTADKLDKPNLACWRQRIRFQLPDGRFAYLKRYNHAPASIQLKSWLQHGRRAFLSEYDKGPNELAAAGVSIPQVIAFGGQRGLLFENRSFIISLEIPGQSLERKLPECFSKNSRQAKDKKHFVLQLADFVRRFHKTGLRHRDLYLCHIFLANDELYLIDLHRCFKPVLLGRRYAVKDLAQLHYSCPAASISRTDRLRFFLAYRGHNKLVAADKKIIRQVHGKALQMAAHDRRHGRAVPFERAEQRESVSC